MVEGWLRSHRGRTRMQNATIRAYSRHLRTRTARRKPA